MRFLQVLSIKMGVFMDKIEFFPTSLGHRGLGARQAGRGLGRRGAAAIAAAEDRGTG